MSLCQQAFSPTVALEMLDQRQTVLVTLVDKAHCDVMSPEMGDAFPADTFDLEKCDKASALQMPYRNDCISDHLQGWRTGRSLS
jgi:hypothetical protein